VTPRDPRASHALASLVVELPDEILERIAERAAEIVLAELQRTSPPSSSPYLTVKEAATYLRCQRQRIDDLLSQRRLTRVKEGGRTLVLRAEVEALAVAHVLPSRPETRIGRAA